MSQQPEEKRHLIDNPGWLESLQRAGVDVQQLAAALPCEVEMVSRAPHLLKPDDTSRLLAECANQTGDTHFGLHMVEFAPARSMGIYGYLLLNAPTIGQLLHIAEKYYPIFYRGAELEVNSIGSISKLRFTRSGPEAVSPRHGNEWVLALFMELIRSWFAEEWNPICVRMTHEQPDDLSELHRVFGQYLLFHQAETSFEFERSLLEQPNPGADTSLLRVFMAHADELLEAVVADRSFEARVRLVILDNLIPNGAGASHIARQLCMSVSTLKRRLKEHNFNYRSLRERTIIDLACKALSSTDSSISNIALKLGYSELSAFDRAFSKATGLAPRAYRQSKRQ